MINPQTHDASGFSLTVGGPIYRFFCRTGLSGEVLEWAHRRILLAVGITWLPLLVLSILGPQAHGPGVAIPFFYDIEVHVRFLISLPLMFTAELVVHHWLGTTAHQFVERRLVSGEDLPKFRKAEQTALKLRDSAALELLLLGVVATAGVWILRNRVDMSSGYTAWYGAGATGYTWAGLWYVIVSVPIFQFFLLRWYMRLLIWIWFLWKVSRLKLLLDPMHTDGAGGIGFLGQGSYAFAPFLFAQGALLSGLIAKRVIFLGQSLESFRVEAFGLILFVLFLVLGPLTLFTPMLIRTRWRGEVEYGKLMSDFTQAFHRKWINRESPRDEEILQQPDFSALVDLGSSYSAMATTRVVPFSIEDAIWLVVATVAPLLPLALTVLSPDELVSKAVQFLF